MDLSIRRSPILLVAIAACGGGHPTSVPVTSAATASANATASSAVPVAASGSAAAPPNGRIPPEVIQRIVRANFADFRQCYEAALKKDPSIKGRTSTRFVIDRSGHVSSSSDVGSDGTLPPEVSKCVADRFMKLEFPLPEGGNVTVVYPLVFSNGESAPTADAVQSGGVGLGGAPGAFDKQAAAVATGKAAGNIQSCAKPNGPTGAGHIKVTFEPSGHVRSVEVDTAPFANTPVGGCIAARFRDVQIPPFDGNPVTIGKSFTLH